MRRKIDEKSKNVSTLRLIRLTFDFVSFDFITNEGAEPEYKKKEQNSTSGKLLHQYSMVYPIKDDENIEKPKKYGQSGGQSTLKGAFKHTFNPKISNLLPRTQKM